MKLGSFVNFIGERYIVIDRCANGDCLIVNRECRWMWRPEGLLELSEVQAW